MLSLIVQTRGSVASANNSLRKRVCVSVFWLVVFGLGDIYIYMQIYARGRLSVTFCQDTVMGLTVIGRLFWLHKGLS